MPGLPNREGKTEMDSSKLKNKTVFQKSIRNPELLLSIVHNAPQKPFITFPEEHHRSLLIVHPSPNSLFLIHAATGVLVPNTDLLLLSRFRQDQ